MTLGLEQPATAERGRRILPAALTIGGLAAATLALRLRDPHVQGSWGVCPSYALFGVYCPGCGGLRAVNDLAHGDLAAAVSSNLLLVASVPLVVFLLGRWLLDGWRGTTRPPGLLTTPWFYVTLVVLLVAFTLLRNLPGGEWLQP
ncbi:conserved membrane hypothetical protein [metagenome]|uniref:DUF2752 domain-containing protein n=1 Tax=metagenome TaxID=256318 RepID=A0A2P2BWE0_9ZZZZ